MARQQKEVNNTCIEGQEEVRGRGFLKGGTGGVDILF